MVVAAVVEAVVERAKEKEEEEEEEEEETFAMYDAARIFRSVQMIVITY